MSPLSNVLIASILALSSRTVAALLVSASTKPQSYPYEFIDFQSAASPGTPSNYTGLSLQYDIDGPNADSDNRTMNFNPKSNGIYYTINQPHQGPIPHNSMIHNIYPDPCIGGFCTGGISLAASKEVLIDNLYAGDAKFWLDLHNGIADVPDPAAAPTLVSDGAVFYICDTKRNGVESYFQLFWGNSATDVPSWCGQITLEAHYPF